MDITIVKVEFSFSVHATEDIDKNLEAIYNIVPLEIIEETNIKQERLVGGYGNPVEFFQIIFTKKKQIDNVIQNIALKLSENEKMSLADEFDERFDSDKSTLYFRVKKESAIRNKIRITSSSNAIKIAIKMRSFVKGVDYKKFLINAGILD